MPTRAIYTYGEIQKVLNTMIHGRRANLTAGETGDTDIERYLINRGVREALSEIDFRGTQREASLSPNLMNRNFRYVLPSDVKGDAIISLQPQNEDTRGEFETYDIVPDDEFDRRKKRERGIVAITNDGLTRGLKISADIEDHQLRISQMEDTNWKSFDTTSVNDSDVKVDQDDYIEGNGAIRFQTDTTDSTDSVVGIQNTVIPALDISSYLARGQAFADAKLTVADTGIHQITLRLGSDSNNYYQISDSNQNDCSDFVTGWNKIRWDLRNKTTVGSPADTAIDYAAIFWSRDTTTVALLHLNDTDWGFDNLILARGKYYNLSYYSRYAWQDTALALAENSTHDSHALLLQNDEFSVVMNKIAELASNYLRDYNDEKKYASEYQRLKGIYEQNNPSEAMILTTTRYNFGSTEEKVSDSGSDT